MTEAQLIVLREGVFRPATLVHPSQSHFMGIDLEQNLALGEEKIDPSSVQLVQSAVLGELRYSDSNESIQDKRYFGWKSNDIYGILSDLIGKAAQLANRSGTPLFGLTAFASPVTEPIPLGFQENLLEIVRRSTVKIYDENQKVEFVLHPTVNLYLRRK